MGIKPTVRLTSPIPLTSSKDYEGPVLHPDAFVVKCEHKAAEKQASWDTGGLFKD